MTLQQHPLLAAQWADDHLRVPGEIHVGFAVDTDAGLLVAGRASGGNLELARHRGPNARPDRAGAAAAS